ncbi:MAG: hypothetical protein BroJett026_40720 [Betaproteobacteria bacterium]|nr:MAG: hypothetical protein BroJett026_40720 [Betaproteobacteria bacterium]
MAVQNETIGRWAPWAAAALIGLVLAVALLPASFVLPSTGAAWRVSGDIAQHVVAQRYFIATPWGWPLLVVPELGGGTNIALADGIPLLALPLKALAMLLPAGFHGIGIWHALVVVLQPLAAVWCLRQAGERRLAPAIGVALAAAAMPAWLARHGHAALMGHFLLLLGLGAYLRLVRAPSTAAWAAAAGLSLAALLTHPYLAVMVLALLGAAPLTLLLRRDARWRRSALGAAFCAGVVAVALATLGYLGAAGEGGYGRYALNLLSPVWPARSALFPVVAGEVDATGMGGWEGYNWLGAGLLAGLAVLAVRAPGALAGALRRHAGLALALAALTLLAMSFRVGFGSHVVLDLGPPPALLDQFRASGRFFWPVGYALLIGMAALVARIPRTGPALVLLLGLVQWIDAAPNREALADWAARRLPWSVDAAALRPAIADARRLIILPSWVCIPPEGHATRERVQELLLLASEWAVPVNTMQLARWRVPPRCTDAETAAAPSAPDELRLVLPEAAALLGDAAECRPLGGLIACRGPG